ncbi:MAG TPA: right-handed parallel beta-helix repeat-containing protein [Vicinamibacterales bacterium]|nr:right-handed parallel beta-helix repeat-containing protein [Vicinamibacterales bacterium]
MQQLRILIPAVLLALCLTAGPRLRAAATVNVDCNGGAAIGPILGAVKPGDVIVVQGACRENLLIPSEVLRITLDGQGKTTIDPPDARRPAVQVLGREVTIKGFTVTGGTFGIAINRGATGTIDRNTVRNASISGLEVSHNGFARIVNNTVERNQQEGILILGSASAHIGIIGTDDQIPSPNVVRDNGRDGIQVLRGSTARIIGNTISGNGRNGLTVQQASHADVAGNMFDGNAQHGIRVVGNSGVNLADSAMLLFTRPNTTASPNGAFGIRCDVGAYIDGPIGGLAGKVGAKDVSDKSCIDRSGR